MSGSYVRMTSVKICLALCLSFLLPQYLSAQTVETKRDTQLKNQIIGRCGCDSCDRMPTHNPAFDGLGDPNGFILSTRWDATAMSGFGLGLGDATILTWSIIPDGADADSGGAPVPSNLIAEFDSRFSEANAGTPDLTNRTWFALIEQGLNRWGEVSGIEYVYEPNDDGVDNFGAGGALGVRGDVRIGGFNIDGPGNVLAFNAFPDNGDMALDTTDPLYQSAANNFRAMRNIITHEAGHGLGLSHVEPTGNPAFLMNPFINVAFDGPQLDDILAVHRGYGDIYEKENGFEGNDTIANATDMGTLAANTTSTFGSDGASGTFVGGNDVDFLSVDDNSDIDFFRFNMATQSVVSVTLTPVGVSYLNGPQGGPAPTLFEPSLNNDLALAVFDASGNLVQSVDSTTNGEAETIGGLILPAGEMFVRATGSSNAVQLFELEITLEEPQIALALGGPVPQTISPEGGTVIPVEVTSFSSTPDPSTAMVFVDRGAGFEAFPMIEDSSTMYSAVMPSSTCGDEIQFYFSIDTVSGETVTLPSNPPTTTFSTISAFGIEELFIDSFDSDLGWTVSGNATDGQWERGIPNNGERGDPEADPEESGLGFCFVTDNGNIPDDNTDVDGGTTILTSPMMVADFAEGDIPRISYYRWYSNTFGASPEADIFEVEISNDNGATWVDLETVGPTGPEVDGGWIFRNIPVGGLVSPNDQVRVRFIASDLGEGSVIEAGVDAVNLSVISCTPQFVLGDVNCDGVVNLLDVAPFVDAISTGVFNEKADMNQDGAVNLLDVDPFIILLNG